MEDKELARHAEESLAVLYRLLAAAADDYDFEVRQEAESITVEFENPQARFVVGAQNQARQICVSAAGKTYKLSWDIVEAAFVVGGTGETLKEVMEEAISERLGEEFSL